jgi:hypothetical protein
MTMHLVGPWMTTNKISSKKKKSAKQAKAQEEHDKWLMSRGLHSSQRKQIKPKKLVVEKFVSTTSHIPSMDTMVGSTAKKAENIYTGTEIIGIAQMHKSNAVPIRNKKSAEEVAKMRRG